MTTKELDNSFKLYLDKVDSQATPDFILGERERILNDALLWVAKEICSKKDNNQDEVDMRRTLSTTLNLQLSKGSYNSAAAPLPDNYLHHGLLAIQLQKPYQNHRVGPRIVSEAELFKVLDDVFAGPTIGEPVVCFTENQLLAFPGASCDKILGAYYRRPALISLKTPEAPVDLVEAKIPTLLQRAVQLALESIADPRFTTQAQIATIS